MTCLLCGKVLQKTYDSPTVINLLDDLQYFCDTFSTMNGLLYSHFILEDNKLVRLIYGGLYFRKTYNDNFQVFQLDKDNNMKNDCIIINKLLTFEECVKFAKLKVFL